MDNSYIYVVRFNDGVKVGKADNVDRRIKYLEKLHGKVGSKDYTVFELQKDDVIAVERALHKILRKTYKQPKIVGDGSTEFYCVDSYFDFVNLVKNKVVEITKARVVGNFCRYGYNSRCVIKLLNFYNDRLISYGGYWKVYKEKYYGNYVLRLPISLLGYYGDLCNKLRRYERVSAYKIFSISTHVHVIQELECFDVVLHLGSYLASMTDENIHMIHEEQVTAHFVNMLRNHIGLESLDEKSQKGYV